MSRKSFHVLQGCVEPGDQASPLKSLDGVGGCAGIAGPQLPMLQSTTEFAQPGGQFCGRAVVEVRFGVLHFGEEFRIGQPARQQRISPGDDGLRCFCRRADKRRGGS